MVSSRTQAPCHRNAVETVCVRTALRPGGNRDPRVTGTDAIICYHFARRCERAARLRKGGPFAKGRPVCQGAARLRRGGPFAKGRPVCERAARPLRGRVEEDGAPWICCRAGSAAAGWAVFPGAAR